jgi:hypothetical protein
MDYSLFRLGSCVEKIVCKATLSFRFLKHFLSLFWSTNHPLTSSVIKDFLAKVGEIFSCATLFSYFTLIQEKQAGDVLESGAPRGTGLDRR